MYERQVYLIKKELEGAKIPLTLEGYYVAGGALTSVFSNTKINDIDIYFYSEHDFNNFLKGVYDHPDIKVKPIIETDNALSYNIDGTKVQLIKKIFGPPSDILDQFDFTICQCAYVPSTSYFVIGTNFMDHLCQRILVFNINAKFPINSLYRMKKFINKGFQVPAVDIIKLGLSINNLNIKNYRDLKEQLDGIDTIFLKDLTDAMLGRKDDEYDFRNAITFINDILKEKYED